MGTIFYHIKLDSVFVGVKFDFRWMKRSRKNSTREQDINCSTLIWLMEVRVKSVIYWLLFKVTKRNSCHYFSMPSPQCNQALIDLGIQKKDLRGTPITMARNVLYKQFIRINAFLPLCSLLCNCITDILPFHIQNFIDFIYA